MHSICFSERKVTPGVRLRENFKAKMVDFGPFWTLFARDFEKRVPRRFGFTLLLLFVGLNIAENAAPYRTSDLFGNPCPNPHLQTIWQPWS